MSARRTVLMSKPKPLPGFERYKNVSSLIRPNRHLAEVNETKKPLDAFNDTLPVGQTLHPTKGYRFRSARGIHAAMMLPEMRHDFYAWVHKVAKQRKKTVADSPAFLTEMEG